MAFSSRTLLLLCTLAVVSCLAGRPRHMASRGSSQQQLSQRNSPSIPDTPKGPSKSVDVPVTTAPKTADATGAPIIRPTTTAPQKWLRSLCQKPRGLYPHPLDCRKYLDCWDGRVLEVYCPNDLVFSDLSGGFCDYLEYVDCGSRPVSISATSKPAIIGTLETSTEPMVKGENWVTTSDGLVPVGSMDAGHEFGSAVFIGRTYVDAHLLPCTVVQGVGCRLAWNNTEYMMKQYEILVKTNVTWTPTDSNSVIPFNVLKAGYLNFGLPLEILYVGRANIGDELTPGYLSSSRPWLVQTLNGSTYFANNFEILTVA